MGCDLVLLFEYVIFLKSRGEEKPHHISHSVCLSAQGQAWLWVIGTIRG